MDLRRTNLAKLDVQPFDVLIIGAGINGAVAAAALAGRGAKVALIDRGDFAGGTSQESSNLAWGGIKYLETYEFSLVRKLCASRNELMRAYPSTVQEIRFFANLEKGFRYPAILLFGAALFYWAMGRLFTKAPRYLTRKRIAAEEPAVETKSSIGGIEYSDAYLHDNDSRFVFGFVRQALDHGCIAANYVEAVEAFRRDGAWYVVCRDKVSGQRFDVTAKVLINACGPWADALNQRIGQRTPHHHVFSKGIHLIVDRITPVRRVLTFFADDGRLFFAIPMGGRTVVGTTDTRVPTPEAHVTDEDRQFVLDNINKRLRLGRPLTKADVIAERCGVRPLVVEGGGEGSEQTEWIKLSRKHAVDVDEASKVITIFGGKLTDCINVGDEITVACEGLGVSLAWRDHKWYGEPPAAVRETFMHQARLMGLDHLTARDASEPLSNRLWRRYGRRAFDLLEDIRRDPRNGEVLIESSEYLRCELLHTNDHEMVVELDDFLRRRSKISLVVRRDRLRASAGLKEACRILFGTDAEDQWRRAFPEAADEPFDLPPEAEVAATPVFEPVRS